MSLAKKKSRSITVADVEYRYQISTSKMDENANFSMNLTIHREFPKGKALTVQGLMTRDFWIDFSDRAEWTESDYPVIKPSHIAATIQKAISLGWDSSKASRAFKIETTNDEFFKFIT